MQKNCLSPTDKTRELLCNNAFEIQEKIAGIPADILWGGRRKNRFFKVSTPERPLITIITVVYNGKTTLEQTIQSVIKQTYDNVEYLIIDGGSTDGTLEIIQKYDLEIDFWLSEPDSGLYDAMNKGIYWSGNSIIAFLNADDVYIDKYALEHIAQYFIEQPQLQIVYGKIRADYPEENCTFLFGKQYTKEDLKKGQCPPHPAIFIRKKILDAQGGFDLQYKTASDYDLICKCLLNQNIPCLFTNQIITQFRLGGTSARPETELEKAEIIYKYFGLISYISYQLALLKHIRLVIRRFLIVSGLIHLWRKMKKLKEIGKQQGDREILPLSSDSNL